MEILLKNTFTRAEIWTCDVQPENNFTAAVLILLVVGRLLSHQITPKMVASAPGDFSFRQQAGLSKTRPFPVSVHVAE